MKRILVTGAGGSPSTNFVRSLRATPEKFYIVGIDANKYYLMRAETSKRYLVPSVDDSHFFPIVNKIIQDEKIDFIHIQNDTEMKFFSENREMIGVNVFLPSKETVRICQNKYLSYIAWEKAGISVPKTMMINTGNDLKKAFDGFEGSMWLRATTGAGGRGSLAVENLKTAKAWIDFHSGWGTFTASELLRPESVTWMSIWKNGKLIVAQGRRRLYWELAKISPSGITGVTGAGVTVSDSIVDDIAMKSIFAIDKKPHGLFGVDLTYNRKGIPNPTEINIGRFFTTHHFFTEAGLNMPYIYIKLAFGENIPKIKKKINPLKKNLVWIRGMDFEPILTTVSEITRNVRTLNRQRKKL